MGTRISALLATLEPVLLLLCELFELLSWGHFYELHWDSMSIGPRQPDSQMSDTQTSFF